MFKKIVLSTVMILFLGGLVFGAAYRTLAKNSSNSSLSEARNGTGSGRSSNSSLEAESTSGIWQGKGSSSEAEITSGSGQGRNSSSQGGNRNGDSTGEQTHLSPAEPGDLSDEEAASLTYMREEEKLAHDVYMTLHAQWNLPIFQNIANSEQTHTDAIQELLDGYGLADPTSTEVGVFTNPDLQALYTQLVAQGSTSLAEALKVGAAIEEIDILDLDEALAQTDNPDIQQVFTNLRKGSENHLRAFTSQLLNQAGEVYQPQYLSPEAYQAIIGSGTQPGGGYGNGGSANGSGSQGGRGRQP